MYLKSLEISGFKSFAKKAELTFNTPITSIVGPNGSGKSNTAEAFRFVLGEQSLKSMRGKKGEDMIWNGSDGAPRANRAAVKITFDNSRRFLNLDFDEVTVERAVFRDGVNEYLINGTRVRLKDVLELLASAHIGSSGHHIISQGEADRILNSNVKERKAMIEDALGLKIYQYKMDESERKLAKTEENKKSVESLRREILPHIKYLKKQVEKVEKAAEMKATLATLYKKYLKFEHLYVHDAKATLIAEKTPIDARLKELETELTEAKAILEKSSSHDKKSDQIISLEETIRRVRNQKDEIFRDMGRTEGSIAAEERIRQKEAELAQTLELNVSIKEVEQLATEVESKIAEAEKETEPTALRAIIGRVRTLISDFVVRHRQASTGKTTADSEKLLLDLRAKKTDLEAKLLAIQNEEENLSKEYANIRTEIDAEKDTNRAAEKKLFEVMTAQNDVIAKRSIIRAREESLRIEEEDYKREMGEAAAIIGREVLDFASENTDEENNPGSNGESHAGAGQNDRSAQHERRRELEKIKIRLEESGVGSAGDILKEFQEVSERDAFLLRELDDLEKSAESLKVLITDFAVKISTEFALGLEKINKQFTEYFSTMFGGGEAKLVLIKEKKRRIVDPELAALEGLLPSSADFATNSALSSGDGSDGSEDSAAEEGIDISVNLPRKKVKGLMMLSGGERALTSIALIFAMSQVKPPPFIILDETDAALDEANSKKYGDMIENLAKYSQLILITHNRETMARAGVLYGVTMLSGVSKLLSIQFDEAVVVAK